jgi:hypothetical protein
MLPNSSQMRMSSPALAMVCAASAQPARTDRRTGAPSVSMVPGPARCVAVGKEVRDGASRCRELVGFFVVATVAMVSLAGFVVESDCDPSPAWQQSSRRASRNSVPELLSPPAFPIDEAVILDDVKCIRPCRLTKNDDIGTIGTGAWHNQAVAAEEMRRFGYFLGARIFLLAFLICQLAKRRCLETERRQYVQRIQSQA